MHGTHKHPCFQGGDTFSTYGNHVYDHTRSHYWDVLLVDVGKNKLAHYTWTVRHGCHQGLPTLFHPES